MILNINIVLITAILVLILSCIRLFNLKTLNESKVILLNETLEAKEHQLANILAQFNLIKLTKTSLLSKYRL